ncbi:hypothetical protein RintRC_4104 [Richelia intracellularis]|nr:hypothetical protein RintRC_4104 [Richelia intracellularis]
MPKSKTKQKRSQKKYSAAKPTLTSKDKFALKRKKNQQIRETINLLTTATIGGLFLRLILFFVGVK